MDVCVQACSEEKLTNIQSLSLYFPLRELWPRLFLNRSQLEHITVQGVYNIHIEDKTFY